MNLGRISLSITRSSAPAMARWGSSSPPANTIPRSPRRSRGASPGFVVNERGGRTGRPPLPFYLVGHGKRVSPQSKGREEGNFPHCPSIPQGPKTPRTTPALPALGGNNDTLRPASDGLEEHHLCLRHRRRQDRQASWPGSRSPTKPQSPVGQHTILPWGSRQSAKMVKSKRRGKRPSAELSPQAEGLRILGMECGAVERVWASAAGRDGFFESLQWEWFPSRSPAPVDLAEGHAAANRA